MSFIKEKRSNNAAMMYTTGHFIHTNYDIQRLSLNVDFLNEVQLWLVA